MTIEISGIDSGSFDRVESIAAFMRRDMKQCGAIRYFGSQQLFRLCDEKLDHHSPHTWQLSTPSLERTITT